MKQLSIGLLVIGILALAGLAYNQTDNKLGNISYSASLGTNSSSTVTSTAALLFRVDPSIQLVKCTNTGNADASISATTTNLQALSGWVIRSSTTDTWTGDELLTGPWYGITASAATTTLSCFRY